MVSIFASSLSVTATEKEQSTLREGYRFGAFLLECSDVEGLEVDYHIGGLSNLDITVTSQEFMIATVPFWGTTMIEEEVQIHLTIENFFGLIQTNSHGYTEIMGLCRNIEWEIV